MPTTETHAVPRPETESGTRKLYAIRRVDRPGTSLQFIVQVRRQMEVRTRTFSVSACGSEEKALEAAVRWRDETLRVMEPMLRSVYASQVRPNNTSGVPGVIRCVVNERTYWLAVSPNTTGRRRRTKAFNIERYGEKEAFRLAVQTRQRYLQEYEAYRIPNAPKDLAPIEVPPTTARARAGG